jgi:hypothetical protein
MFKNGINVQTGYQTFISVTRDILEKKGGVYSDCIDDLSLVNNGYANHLYGYMRALNVTKHNQDYCFSLCYQDKLIEKCSCIDIDGPLIAGSNFCSSPTEIECLLEFDDFYAQTNIVDLCSNACPQK